MLGVWLERALRGRANLRPGRRPATKGRRILLAAVVAVAVLSALAGAMMIASRRPQPALQSSATVAGITASLHTAGWLSMEAHEMDTDGGYQMPAQMMPGAPPGDELRLGIPVTLRNATGQARAFDLAKEFFLVGGGSDKPVNLVADTFGTLTRLNPESGVDGVLYFDTTVPAAGADPLVLRWIRAGHTIDLAVPWSGASTPPTHHH